VRPLLVTGCGRSGTAWIAEVIEACGWPCGHEVLFCHGRDQPDAFLAGAAEASGTAAPWVDAMRDAGAVVVHQVRHPRGVVRAVLHHRPGKPSARTARRIWRDSMCPELTRYTEQPAAALAYWVHWNALVDGSADEMWQVERLWSAEQDAVDLLATMLTVSGRPTTRERAMAAVRGTSKQNAGLPGEAPTWAELRAADEPLAERALEMCARYGYEP